MAGDATEPADESTGLLPPSVHGRSLVGAVALAALVPLLAVTGEFQGPVDVAIALTFPLYFAAGVYRPWREAIPYYDQLLGVPLFTYGVYLVVTEWPSILGVIFAAFGGLALAQIVRDWYVSVDVPDVE
jgi:hypothetical protein